MRLPTNSLFATKTPRDISLEMLKFIAKLSIYRDTIFIIKNEKSL